MASALSGTSPRPIVSSGHCVASNFATAGPVVSTCWPAEHRSEMVTTAKPGIYAILIELTLLASLQLACNRRSHKSKSHLCILSLHLFLYLFLPMDAQIGYYRPVWNLVRTPFLSHLPFGGTMRTSRLLAILSLTAGLVVTALAAPPKSIYDFTLQSIDGQPTPLSEYHGKVVLLVNVASRCGFTPQYTALE